MASSRISQRLVKSGHLRKYSFSLPANFTPTHPPIAQEYDVLSARKQAVYISLSTDLDKLQHFLPDAEDLSNTAFVVEGQGLPDDDDDDDDFPLDLQQWNEPGAFEKHLFHQENNEDEDDEDDNDITARARLEKEQDLVRKRMKAPLPKRLPVDEDPHAEDEDDAPSRFQAQAIAPALVLGKKAPAPGPGEEDDNEEEEAENKPPPAASAHAARSPLKKRQSNVIDAQPVSIPAKDKGKGKLVFPRVFSKPSAPAPAPSRPTPLATSTRAATAVAEPQKRTTRSSAAFQSLNDERSDDEDAEGSQEEEEDQLDSEAEL